MYTILTKTAGKPVIDTSQFLKLYPIRNRDSQPIKLWQTGPFEDIHSSVCDGMGRGEKKVKSTSHGSELSGHTHIWELKRLFL